MFDRIAHSYDLLNRTLSLGRDVAWRKRMAGMLPDRSEQHVLDLATGTADQILSFFRASDAIRSGVGLDLAEQMLDRGRAKIATRGLSERISLEVGDASRIPFGDGTFDAVSISFGIRNVADVRAALSEMYRVLKAGGRALILECSLPSNRLLRKIYLLYFRHVLPRLGGLISGDFEAYRYLNETVETFPSSAAFCALMEEAGFREVAAHPQTLGVATIYVGDKIS